MPQATKSYELQLLKPVCLEPVLCNEGRNCDENLGTTAKSSL